MKTRQVNYGHYLYAAISEGWIVTEKGAVESAGRKA